MSAWFAHCAGCLRCHAWGEPPATCPEGCAIYARTHTYAGRVSWT